MHHDDKDIPKCDRFPDISEYLDGELSPNDEISLEQHFTVCPACRTEFEFQKQFHNALSATLEDDPGLKLPDNFTKVIVTAAESDVGSVRQSHEVRNAFAIVIGILFVASVIAALSGGISLGGIGLLLDKGLAVIIAGSHLIYSFALGIFVILRSVTGGISDQAGLWLTVGAIAVFILLILIFYFRPRTSRNA